ncbi:hypothetical protein GCM10022255_106590 [Dactylosporangium darangshiense]|uniref:Uncharacterized protein n=1 Tax=Dactylosporangium darangshiense TaxID=579108 RepID=A0ABP8DTL4_9ACTN
MYVESPSRPAAIAVPKYRPDCAAAAPRVLAAALAAGIIVAAPATAATATAAPSASRIRNGRTRFDGLLVTSDLLIGLRVRAG